MLLDRSRLILLGQVWGILAAQGFAGDRTSQGAQPVDRNWGLHIPCVLSGLSPLAWEHEAKSWGSKGKQTLPNSWGLDGKEPVLVGENRDRQGGQGPPVSPCRRCSCCTTELLLGCLGCVRKISLPTVMKDQTTPLLSRLGTGLSSMATPVLLDQQS